MLVNLKVLFKGSRRRQKQQKHKEFNINEWTHSGSPFLWYQQNIYSLHAYIWQRLSSKATGVASITREDTGGLVLERLISETVKKDQPNDTVLSSKVRMNVQASVCISTSGDAGPGTAHGFSFCHQQTEQIARRPDEFSSAERKRRLFSQF